MLLIKINFENHLHLIIIIYINSKKAQLFYWKNHQKQEDYSGEKRIILRVLFVHLEKKS